jgi:serine/threonine protein kinase
MSITVGSVVGEYEVLGHLGAGGIGEVYRVKHLISDRVEAMKVLLPERTEGDSPERFIREIRVLASLRHPNIAGLHTAFRIEDRTFMIMEFIEGENLRSRLKTGTVNMAEGMRYVAEVLSALEYAHARGVIHRDIKPSNVMITPEGQTKLLDFGLALNRTGDRNLTIQGHILGSLNYMSPEQIRSEPVDSRTDIYSTGVMLYELLTGRSPVEGKTDYEVLMGHLEREPRAPVEVNQHVPVQLSQTVMRALRKDAAHRFQTAAEFSDELRNMLVDEGPTRTMLSVVLPEKSTKSDSKHPSTTLDSAALDKVSKQLATYIGPIAKVVVKRAAGRCSTVEELASQVAKEIESDKERSAFLAALKKAAGSSV